MDVEFWKTNVQALFSRYRFVVPLYGFLHFPYFLTEPVELPARRWCPLERLSRR